MEREAMSSHKVGILPGDGIGTEVTTEALKAIDAAGVKLDTVDYPLGGEHYLATGEVLPDSILDEWRGLDAILLGAVGHPEVAPGILERGLLLKARFELDLYINLRPVKLLPGVRTPIADVGAEEIDMVVIRENTEGIYGGAGGVLRKGTPDEVATQESLNTRMGVERCIRYAFGVAEDRSRKHLTMVHKTNVLTNAGDLWMRAFEEVGSEHPSVERAYNHVDAACLYMVESPRRFDVMVTDNLFGDIVTDLGAAIAGGMGLAASGNINPEKTAPSVFEPVHGSAPDIAGTGKANPLASILSGAMLLDFLGETRAASAIEAGVSAAIPELGLDAAGGMSATTSEAGDLVAARIVS